jgi:hypothetical protein
LSLLIYFTGRLRYILLWYCAKLFAHCLTFQPEAKPKKHDLPPRLTPCFRDFSYISLPQTAPKKYTDFKPNYLSVKLFDFYIGQMNHNYNFFPKLIYIWNVQFASSVIWYIFGTYEWPTKCARNTHEAIEVRIKIYYSVFKLLPYCLLPFSCALSIFQIILETIIQRIRPNSVMSRRFRPRHRAYVTMIAKLHYTLFLIFCNCPA